MSDDTGSDTLCIIIIIVNANLELIKFLSLVYSLWVITKKN